MIKCRILKRGDFLGYLDGTNIIIRVLIRGRQNVEKQVREKERHMQGQAIQMALRAKGPRASNLRARGTEFSYAWRKDKGRRDVPGHITRWDQLSGTSSDFLGSLSAQPASWLIFDTRFFHTANAHILGILDITLICNIVASCINPQDTLTLFLGKHEQKELQI